ncbi:MAG TPA: DUF1036 domain-containing protein [Rhizomicrobium sp.]|nr:DUF1036 domain-containing protein [Rhizomicrobium sp.]
MYHMRRLLLAILICAASPASARLAVCNKAAGPAKVALGRFDGATWMSEGWWTIAPRACATLIDTPLRARYYYLFATDGGAGSWSGSRSFCVSETDKFSIGGRGDCASRGYDQKSFFEVDTGNKPDWTQFLSD